jgi:uracil-DNA glycosylase
MPNVVKIASDWGKKLEDEFSKPYFTDLITFVRTAYAESTVFPPGKEIFRAFDTCNFDQTRVVIVGQDPYHGAGQANGLCFSVRNGLRFPPSLVNIFKEVSADLNVPVPDNGDLERWAVQGVLLLNATLTVQSGSPGSHQNKGWEIFTDAVIDVLSREKAGLVFLLWGSYAQNKGALIDRKKHFVLEAPHPSPFSVHRGFFGCKHFSKTNAYLVSQGQKPISW